MNKNYEKPTIIEEGINLTPFMLEESKEFGKKEDFEIEKDFIW